MSWLTLCRTHSQRAIYNVEVLESTVTFDLVPRSLEEQRQWLTARSGAHAVLVAERDGDVIGFASLSPYRDRPAYSRTVTFASTGMSLRGRWMTQAALYRPPRSIPPV